MVNIRVISEHDDVKRHRQCIEVDLESPRLVLDHLSTHEATGVAFSLESSAVDTAVDGTAPIDQANALDLFIFTESAFEIVDREKHDVVRLEIAVNDVFPVKLKTAFRIDY